MERKGRKKTPRPETGYMFVLQNIRAHCTSLYNFYQIPVIILILVLPSSVKCSRHYCGQELTTILELVCRGEYYDGGRTYDIIRHRRSSSSDFQTLTVDTTDSNTLKEILIQKKGIIDECCIQSCTKETLASYCLSHVSYAHRQRDESIAELEPIITEPGTTAMPETTKVEDTNTIAPVASTGAPIRTRGSRIQWFYVTYIGQKPMRFFVTS